MPPVSRFTFHVSRFTPHASRSQRGVALIVTLLLLSIITFMTITFLVVSRSQKGSVVTETDQSIARLAADTALERAKAELLAGIMGFTNEFNYGLMVSTNYIKRNGFDQTLAPGNPFNVNYDYTSSGAALTPDQRLQNIANLLYNPRPPVFVVTNALTRSNEFRFYLDLNRNRFYDPNGLQPVISSDPANPYININSGGTMPSPTTGLTLSNLFVGDPDWIGSLERPEITHSADNKFVNRYAYIAIPAGNTLDLNTIHNYASALNPTDLRDGDGFLRNQGVLTSEINLAAFLADLNTNLWPFPAQNVYGFAPYFYMADPALHNTGAAFDDASALLRYRLAFNWVNLANVRNLFGAVGALAFSSASIDAYSAGPVMNGTAWPPSGINPNPTRVTGNIPWAGADTPNRFYTTQDLFDQSKTRPPWLRPEVVSFTDRLVMAGKTNNSYDRNTFYRLLSQLGTDSAPEPPGKLNLNYCNVDTNGNVVPGMATGFTNWAPKQFFTNAAIRLLANAGFTVGDPRYATNILVTNYVNGVLITNLHIPLWPTNFYTPSVHRLLQLAANIYDASTNRTFGVLTATNGFPSVFRPIFTSLNSGNQIFIAGYEEVGAASDFLYLPVLDPALPGDRKKLGREDQMVWGVPLVIGARKGLPNFNKFSSQTQVQVTRKLQFHRPGTSTTADVNEIDQMFVVGITNMFGVEAWNSYATTFPRKLRIIVTPFLNVSLTNLETGKLLNPTTWIYRPLQPAVTNIPAGAWSRYDPSHEGASFVLPLASGPEVPYTNRVFLSNGTYSARLDTFVPLTGVFERTLGTTNLHVPHWQLNLRTRLSFAVVDTGLNRIVDYVNLDSTEDPLDITDALMHDTPSRYSSCASSGAYHEDTTLGSMWCTNRPGNSIDNSVLTYGIMNQIAVSSTPELASHQIWNNSRNEFPAGMSKELAIAFFKGQFEPGYLRQSNTFAAPFNPFRNIYKVVEWEANDPLVHYTINDLRNLQRTNSFALDNPDTKLVDLLGHINRRYEPWGGTPKLGTNNAPAYAMVVKDPMQRTYARSDDWDFPTNKFPNIGWLGRVHRGTPWQTVYLKSGSMDLFAWQKWSGNGQFVPYVGQFPTNRLPLYLIRGATNGWFTYDAFLTMPTNDWRILDLFTTGLSDNATRGQLSINQANLAAWSAVLGGVVVLTNALDADANLLLSPQVIQPAGVYDAFNTNTWPPLVRIVNGINRTRASAYVVGNNAFPVFRNYSFQSLGDILAVPELTVASPFLNTNTLSADAIYPNDSLNDAAVERIPQQILGLLKCDHTPRFVVYSFGQALKPADRSLVTSGAFSRLCTNYQVMAEAATRAVVRIDGAPTNAHIVIESFNVLPPD